MPDRDPDLGRFAEPALLVLVSLTDGPKHGYAIMADVEAFGRQPLGPGTLYAVLAGSSCAGLIEPIESDDRRRPYRLTGAGARAVADRLEGLDRFVALGRRRLGDLEGGLTDAHAARPPGAPVAALVRAILRAYPRTWRDRYEHELGGDARRHAAGSRGQVLDLVRGAARRAIPSRARRAPGFLRLAMAGSVVARSRQRTYGAVRGPSRR